MSRRTSRYELALRAARWLTLAVSLVVAPSLAMAERATVELKDGSMVAGELRTYVPGKRVVIVVAGHVMTIAASNYKAVTVSPADGSSPPSALTAGPTPAPDVPAESAAAPSGPAAPASLPDGPTSSDAAHVEPTRGVASRETSLVLPVTLLSAGAVTC
jgi:hypothetical protein